MKRMIIAVLLLSLVLFSVAGCSKKDEKPVEKKEPSKEEPVKEESPKEEQKNEPKETKTSWPEKTIQVIVPFKAGGDTDYNARICATKLEEKLGVPVVVVNVVGSGGSVGTRQVKDAQPDGYTLLFNQTPFLITMANKQIDFDFSAFELVGVVGENPGYVYCVSPKLGVKDIKGLIELSQKEGTDLRIAMNIGGTTQIFAYLLEDAGVKCTQVDIAGANDKAVACIGGHVEIIALPYGNVKQYIDSGDLIAIGQASEERGAFSKEIPTCKEQGYDISFPSRYFFAFPKGTDAAIVEKTAKALEEIITKDEDYAKSIAEAYQQTPLYMDASSAAEFYQKQFDRIKNYAFK